MKRLLMFCLAMAAVNAAQEVCYEHYGCFGLEYPWWSLQRPFPVLPEPPSKVQTRFLLYTSTSNEEMELLINKTGMLGMSDFNFKNPTRFIIHGALGSSYEDSIQKLKNALIKHHGANVIVVDWRPGAELPYSQAAANARLVGVEIAQMVQFLNRQGMDLSTLHLIGHDIGAHAAGYAGKAVYGIGRITGLDPNEPYFGGSERLVRLDSTDATYVDVIHTDGIDGLNLGFGITDPIGHSDYYPNGGKTQPGCGGTIDKIIGTIWGAINMNQISIKQVLGCSHLRAIDLFTDSISSSCPYLSVPCVTWDEYESGRCDRYCAAGRCAQFGFYSNSTTRGKLYLRTNSKSPFCQYSEFVTLTTGDDQSGTDGYLSVKVVGKSGRTEVSKFNGKGTTHLQAGRQYTTIAPARYDIGDVKAVEVEYQNSGFFFKPKLSLSTASVQVYDMKLGSTEFHACNGNFTIASGKKATFNMSATC